MIFDHLRTPLAEPLTAGDPIRPSFEELLEEMAHERPGSRTMIETLVRRWLILFLRRCRQHGHPPPWAAVPGDERLGRVMAAMQDRPHHGFTLSRLAELAGMRRLSTLGPLSVVLRQEPDLRSALDAAGGVIDAVTDKQILEAYHWLASSEGVFCEPASAASVAGLLAHGLPVAEGMERPASVVCVLTGHGLKDPDSAIGKAPAVTGCKADLAAVEKAVFD